MLNPVVIEELKSLPADDGGDLFTQFAKMFLEAYPKHLDQIQCFLDSSDFKSLEREAHTLKSVCANLGATELADLARDIERGARLGDSTVVPHLILEMRNSQSSIRGALDQLLADID